MTTSWSAALSSDLHRQASRHLLRRDGQEDLCFGLWHPSRGRTRNSALVRSIILLREGERVVHGNASFLPHYFERAILEARSADAALAFFHSHPGGRGWQGMSDDDIRAERGHAAATQAATGLPLFGMTLASDGSWSGRLWEKARPKVYERNDCTHIRVVGDRFAVTYNNLLKPVPQFRENLRRTISAWGEATQADLARLHVGVVGTGSVGVLVAEALARIGVSRISLIDFDSIEIVNLDRTLHATEADVAARRSKVEVLRRALLRSATSADFRVEPFEYSIGEESAFRAALDCDLLFSCVDRPWGRSVLNFIAYAHLIPVVDGGIRVDVTRRHQLRHADWRAHVAAPGRRCLACLGQYDPGLVAAEREGRFDDPVYIQGLPEEHPVRRNENVFAFSLGAASLQVLQALCMVIAPLGIADIGEQLYHFTTGRLDINEDAACVEHCPYPDLVARGDTTGLTITGTHQKAEEARRLRAGRLGWRMRILQYFRT